MSATASNREFNELLDQLCDEQLGDSGWQRLVELLGQSEAHRQRYLDYVELHATLWSGGVARPAVPWAMPVAEVAPKPLAGPAAAGLGFLDEGRGTWDFLSGHATFVTALAALVVAALALASFTYRGPGRTDVAQTPAASRAGNATPASAEGPGVRAAVAYLARTYDCAWANPDTAPADGDGLQAGQQLSLRSGLLEIVFACGARVILQGPASFQAESARSASLAAGKITVTVESAAAKGFTVRTPGMKAIDLGTEFGLEVAPGGVEQVHVFRGAVDVAASPKKGPAAAPHRLTQSQGMEVNRNTQGVKLVANNGERFARSLDDAQSKRHVVAYWRFEDHPVGVLVPESHEGRAPVRGSLDSSINGNDLYTWSKGTQPRFSADVPSAVVTHSGEANTASLDNSVPPVSPTRDLFTMSAWSRPSLTDLQAITPSRWTIEASVKAAKLNGKFQVFVVRDGINASSSDPKLAPLAFQITPTRHFEIQFCDVAGRVHTATAEAVTVAENHWYHVAASSDGENLKLYVDSLDGKGYLLWAVTGLPTTGSTALARGVYPGNDPLAIRPGMGYPYIWSVGRGYYNGQVTNGFQGWIDEVRICDVALEPAEFVFSPRASATRVQSAGSETK